MPKTVEYLEQLRQSKQYGRVINLLQPSLIDPTKEVPIAIDAARGLIERTYTPDKVIDHQQKLVKLISTHISNQEYTAQIDQHPSSAISHRRDLARFITCLEPLIDSQTANIAPKLRQKARSFVNQDSSHLPLLTIEDQNWQSLHHFHPDCILTNTALKSLLNNPDTSADQRRAAITWSLETIVKEQQDPKPIFDLALINRPDQRIKALIKTRARIRFKQNREKLLTLLRPTVSSLSLQQLSESTSEITQNWI